MMTALRLATVLFVMLVLLALPQPAHAQKTIRVGNGTAASCTQDALRNALAFAGGERSSVVQFKCGAGPVTIIVSATLTVPNNTTINGNGLITLDGQTTISPILRVERDATVALRNLRVDRGGQLSAGPIGGGLFNEGAVTVDGCTFSRNGAGSGGGIFNQGTLAVHDSTFSGNRGLGIGGGIFSQGTLAIHGSTFTGNGSTFGAGIFAEGTLTVHDSVFDGNNPSRSLIAQQDLVLGTVLGTPSGAIHLGVGTHKITHSTISRNNGNENGGGINLLAGTLTVVDSTITQNTGHFGGGIHVHPVTGSGGTATLVVKHSTISENSGVEGGGIVNHGGSITIDDSIITRNTASVGGGIANDGVSVAVKDSTITENTASTFGGGIYNVNSSSAATLAVKDSTITKNIAGSDGGGIYSCCGGIPPRLMNSIVTNNTPNNFAP